MKDVIKCPDCGKILARYEDVVGRGDLYLFCKRCREEKHIQIATLSLDR